MTNEDKRALLACRHAAEEVDCLHDGLIELRRQVIASPRLDGMPRGAATGDGAAKRLIRIEKQEKNLERAKQRLQHRRTAAIRALSKLPVGMAQFCQVYYVEGEPFELAWRASGRSSRQCARYIREVERA